MDSFEGEMQRLQEKIDKKEMILVDDDHYSNSELYFDIEHYTGNLRLSFIPQLGGDNVMSLGADRVEQLIDCLKYYLNKMKEGIRERR
jgi:hypothetical protein